MNNIERRQEILKKLQTTGKISHGACEKGDLCC